MGVTVNVNDLTLVHKDSGGISIATVPDVCKTPSPGGPVPIPYPNIAFAKDLTKGTKKVKVDGGNMAAIYGSEFAKSTGDEPGSVGGVKSSTFMKEAAWITYSFDVKMEGKGACRLTDKMFHNHQNTFNASGVIQKLIKQLGDATPEFCKELAEYIKDLEGEGRTGKDSKFGDIRGLEERFEQQRTGRGGPNDPILQEDIDRRLKQGKNPPTMNRWKGHDKAIKEQQKALKKARDKFDKDCRDKQPPPESSKDWVNETPPQESDWTGPVQVAEKSGGIGDALIQGALIGGAIISGGIAVIGLFCPFDGPAVEVGAGAASRMMWSAAMAM